MQSTYDGSRPTDAVRRILRAAGVGSAALVLTAAAAVPAFADGDGGHGGGSGQADKPQSQNRSQSTPQDQPQDNPQNRPNGDGDEPTSHEKGGTGSKSSDPAGNNGTFFVKQTANDSHPGNQPHVSCSFYLSFFGFDAGQTVSVSFAGQAPTGKDRPVTTTATTTLTSTTPAGGAGNDYDGFLGAFDAGNLDLAGLGAPAKQGYHLKVDVATQQGGGHKYKVFWFSPCTPSGTSSTPSQTGTTPTVSDTDTGGAAVEGADVERATSTPSARQTTDTVQSGAVTGAAEVAGTTVTGTSPRTGTSTAAAPTTRVLGERFTRTPRTSVGVASLPFTGAETGALAAIGAAALGGGTALLVAGRRRRAARSGA